MHLAYWWFLLLICRRDSREMFHKLHIVRKLRSKQSAIDILSHYLALPIARLGQWCIISSLLTGRREASMRSLLSIFYRRFLLSSFRVMISDLAWLSFTPELSFAVRYDFLNDSFFLVWCFFFFEQCSWFYLLYIYFIRLFYRNFLLLCFFCPMILYIINRFLSLILLVTTLALTIRWSIICIL